MNPTLARIPVPFRWNVNDGLNGSSLLARAYNSEIAGVYARTSTKRVVDRNGLLVPLVQGIPALGVFGGEVGLLLEPARTNLCIRSEEFDTWTDSGTCNVSSNAATAPDSTTTADSLTATAAASQRQRSITFTGDGEKCAAVYVKAGTSARSRVSLTGAAGVNRHAVAITWSAGVPSLSTIGGAGTLYPVESLANGWYRILFSATGVIAAEANLLRVFPDDVAGTGTCLFWGAQAEDAAVPSSYIPTAGSTVPRNADSLYFPFTLPPTAMTVYVRGIERARTNLAASANQFLAFIGSATEATDPRAGIYRSTGGAGFVGLHDPASGSFSQYAGATAQRGDRVEVRLTISAAGAARIGASINGGSEDLAAAGAAQALGTVWAAQRLYLNSAGASSVGQFAFTHACVALGEQPLDIMRELAGV